jgi:uncharacterized OB-fold protein
MTVPRPVPRLDPDNRAFWTGGAEGELRIQQCRDCGAFIHPPRAACRRCLSENVAPTAVAGTGKIETFTVNYQTWIPGLDVPYIVARVSLDGAPEVVLTTNIVGCPVDDVDIDDKVKVTFERHGEIFVPLFEKVG